MLCGQDRPASIDPAALPRPTLSRRPPRMMEMHRRLDPTELDRAAQGKPVSYVYSARALRDFGDGFVAVLLPVYLTAIGLGAFEIGVVATLALLGSALMTLAIGLLGARTGSAQAADGGIRPDDRHRPRLCRLRAPTPSSCSSPSSARSTPRAGSVSIFVPLEHAVLSRSVADAERTRMFARYSLIGALAAAVGSLAAAARMSWPRSASRRSTALKGMFVVYAMLGVAGGSLCAPHARTSRPPVADKPVAALGPSRGIVYKMAALFSIDAFAGGFAVQSLIALWLFNKFGLSLTRPACSSSGRACSPPSRFRSPPGCRGASASSTRWCSRTSPPACA